MLTRIVYFDIIGDMSIHLAIKDVGSASKLAKLLGAPFPSRVTNWVKRGVPPQECYPIEKALEGRVRCEDLCPSVTWHRDADGKPYWNRETKNISAAVVNQTMNVCKTPKLGVEL